MRKLRAPSPKKIAEANIRDVEGALYELYRRMTSHIDFEFTEEMVLNTMIRQEDLEFVTRSNKLYGYIRTQYYGSSSVEIIAPSHANDRILIGFKRHVSFVPPHYLVGKHHIEDYNPAFAEAIWPWLEQVVPLREMYRTAQRAWTELRLLTGDDYPRIRALWPTVDALAGQIGRTVPKMPNPKGLPSPSPELREKLHIAQTFINSALLMPEERTDVDHVVTLQLGTKEL